tara:strand:- start:17 stop:298 length:282 start_codon:yes stop_codon:yes gene_type:complete
MKKPAYLFGYPVFFSYIYGVNEARSHAFKIKIKVMSKENQVQELISGYANGFITDRECNEMCDLILNEITIIREDIEVECSAELDNEWANESI